MSEPVMVQIWEDGTPAYESLCYRLQERVEQGLPEPTVAAVPPDMFRMIVRQLDARVDRANDYAFITVCTPFGTMVVRHDREVPAWHIRFSFEDFDRIRAYATFELMERVAVELMERAAQLRATLERTTKQ